MDEKYIEHIYNTLGGSSKFGAYNDFKELISTNDEYRKQFYSTVGEKSLGAYDDFDGLVKKKVGGEPSSATSTPVTSDSPDVRQPVAKQVLNQKPSPLVVTPDVPVEQPETPVQSKVPDFGLKSITQLAKDQRAQSDNTASTEVKADEAHNDIVANAPARTALKKANIKKAVDNTTEKAIAAKGLTALPGSPQYNEQKQKIQAGLDNGDLHFALDKDGTPGLKRNVGFFEGLQRGWQGARQANEDAAKFTNEMDAKQRVEFYNKQQAENPTPPELIGERDNFAGSAGKFLGGAGPFLGKAGAGAAIGTAAIAGAPESMGTSLAGLPVALSFILTAGDMANHGAMDEVLRRYQILKQHHPEADETALMEEAGKGALPGGVGGIVTNAILTGTGTTPVSDAGKSVLRKAITSVAKAGLHMGKATAATDLAVQLEGNIVDDVKATPEEMLKHSANAFTENATTGALLHGLTMAVTGATNLPKIVQSAFKYGLKDVPTNTIEEILHTNEMAGTIPKGSTDKVLADVAGYKEALGKTIDNLDDETRASVAGLIEKKDKLVTEQKTKDDSFKPVYKEQIDAINNQIAEITSTGKPYAHEVDDLTGDKLNSRAPKAVVAENTVNSDVKKPLTDILNKYKDGENYTIQDMVNDVEGLAPEHQEGGKLWEAVDKYRDEQEYDKSVSGRGDMDSAGNEFEAAIKEIAKKEVQPEEVKTEKPIQKEFDFSKTPEDELLKALVSSNDNNELQAIQKELKNRPVIQKTSEAIKSEVADKIVTDNTITPESLPDIEHLFNNSPYTPEDLVNLKEDLNDKPNNGSAGTEPEGKQQNPGSTDNTQSSDAGKTPEATGEASSIKDNGSKTDTPSSDEKALNSDVKGDKNIMYHGSDVDLHSMDIKPIFFSHNKEYSEHYGKNVKAFEVKIDKPFDTSDAEARRIYNEEFLPYAKEKSKGDKRYETLKEGEKVPFTTADLLYVFLRKSKREGRDHGYDGVVVDEKIDGEYSKFPLSREQIKEVSSQKEKVHENVKPSESEHSDYTAIKKDVVNEEREAAGKDKLHSTGDGTKDQAEATFAKIKSGEISEEHIRDLTQALSKGDNEFHTNLTPVERQHALLYDRRTLINKGEEIDKELIDARSGKKQGEVERLLIKKAQNEALMEANDLAASKTGREWSDIGRARQELIKQDYSLAALTRKYKAAGDGTMPEDVKAKFSDLSKQIEDKNTELAEKNAAIAAADAEIKHLTDLNESLKSKKDDFKEFKAETKKEKRVVTKDNLHKEREQIKADLKNKWKKFSRGSLNVGIPLPVEMIPDLVKLAKNYIHEGIVTLDGVVDRVHKDVSEFIDGIDKKAIRDAITGYGKIKKPNTDPYEATFRDLTAQGRLVSAIEDAERGENPKKSGAQRDEPTKEVRDLKKELNKALKDNNIQVVEPEKQMKSALDGAKTRLNNQIEDLTEAISKNQKIEKDHTGIEYDAEAKQLKADRDALRAQYDEIFGTTKELTDEQRLDRAKKAVKKGIDQLQGKIDAGDVSIRKSNTPKSEALDALKKQREELGKVYKALLESSGELDRRKLEALKKSVAKRTAYLEEIKRTGNLDKFLADRVKRKTILDEEAKTAQAAQKKLKNHIDNMLYNREFANMSSFQRGMHWTGRFTKGVLISSPVVLARIAGSVAFRAIYKTPTVLAAYAWTKMLPKTITEKAITESFHTIKDVKQHIGEYYTTLFSKGNYTEMVSAFKNHATNADLLLDKFHKEIPIPKGNNILQKGFFGAMKLLEKNASLHGAGKSLASNPEQRAYEFTIASNFIRSGVTPESVGEPVFKEMVNQLAYLKSKRAKFMQENYVAEAQKSIERNLRQKGMHGTAEVVNAIAPITTIASNYISEALTKIPGLGLSAAAPFFLKGKSELTEKDYSVLMRTLTYQGVGAMSYALGWALSSHLAPFYKSPAKKLAKDEMGEETWFERLWETLSHSPDALVMQAGATHHWFWQKYDKENPNKDVSMSEFMGNVMYPAISNVQMIAGSSPYFQSGSTVLGPLLGQGDAGKAGANFLKARTPFVSMLSDYAQGKTPILNHLGYISDKEEKIKPEDVGIFAHGFVDNIRKGVPGWREDWLKEAYAEKEAKKPKESHAEKIEAKHEAKAKFEKLKEFAAEHGLPQPHKKK